MRLQDIKLKTLNRQLVNKIKFLDRALAEGCYVVESYAGILFFNSKAVHMEISLKKSGTEANFCVNFGFPCQFSIPKVFHTHISSWAGSFETGLS